MVKLENHMESVQNKTNQDLADFSEKLVNYATRMVKLENHKGSVLNFLDDDALSSHLRQHELLHYYDGLVSLGINTVDDLADLGVLTDEDLLELGMSATHRNALIESVAQQVVGK
jgi:hypothetical protein